MAAPTAQRELPIGLSTGAFWRANILDCLAPIREAGFRSIEVASAPSHLDFHDPCLLYTSDAADE